MQNPIPAQACNTGQGLCYLEPNTPGWPENCPCQAKPQPVVLRNPTYGPIIPEEDKIPETTFAYHCAQHNVVYTNAVIHRKIRDEKPG